jgi:secondary thiamine-phosphate synthase enzyme
MKIYNEPIALQSAKPRELFNITTRVKAAMEKSGFRDGIILVSSLQPNAAVIVNEEEPGFLDNLNGWLDQLAPGREVAASAGKHESGATSCLHGLLMPRQVIVSFTEGRLDLGAGQAILFVELEGLRPRRVVVKVIGE